MHQINQACNPNTNLLTGISSRLGLIGLYIFAFGAWLNKGVAITGIALIIIACLLDVKAIWYSTKHSPLIWIVVITSIYILSRMLFAINADPENASLHLKDGLRFFYLCGFILLAWIIPIGQRQILIIFSIAFSGFILARLWHFDWSLSSPIPWWKSRLGLGLPEIAFGYYAATSMIGLLIFTPRIINAIQSTFVRITAALIWLTLIAMTVQGVILSWSRSVWGSLLIVLAILLVACWPTLKSIRKLYLFSAAILLGMSTISILALNSDTLTQRINLEPETYNQVLSGKFGDISTTNEKGQGNSVGIRLLNYSFGIKHWLSSPFFGLGPAASKILLRNSDVPFFSHLNDLHNGPIDILLRLGIVGLFLLGLCLCLTLASGWKAWQNNKLDSDIALFLACGMILILLSMLTNFRMLNSDWRYWIFLFSGTFASFGLHRQVSSDNAP